LTNQNFFSIEKTCIDLLFLKSLSYPGRKGYLMNMRLILVCKEGPARDAYLRETASLGVEVDTVDSFGDLFKTMMINAYSGVMVDVVTSVRASRDEKTIAQDILDAFPIVQLRWDSATNQISVISQGNLSGNGILPNFIHEECRSFSPRAIRLDVRKTIHLNIVMCRQEQINASNMERSVSVNISKGGCFLYSSRDWSHTSEVWFIVNELHDKTPILGEIKWRQPWGKSMAIPGIGISLKHIANQQLVQLHEEFGI